MSAGEAVWGSAGEDYYGAIATNRCVSRLDPAVRGGCEFCGEEETVEHLFLIVNDWKSFLKF